MKVQLSISNLEYVARHTGSMRLHNEQLKLNVSLKLFKLLLISHRFYTGLVNPYHVITLRSNRDCFITDTSSSNKFCESSRIEYLVTLILLRRRNYKKKYILVKSWVNIGVIWKELMRAFATNFK